MKTYGTYFVNDKDRPLRYGENGGLAEHAAFQIRPSDGYVRISVQDEKGNRADSNAYFTDELFA